MKTIVILLLAIITTFTAYGQSSFSAKFVGLTIHPFGDESAALQPYKLDDRAVFVMNFGGVVSYEKYIWRDLVSYKVLQAVFADCSAGLASITNLAIQGVFLKKTYLSI
jgi:hypothetical protein